MFTRVHEFELMCLPILVLVCMSAHRYEYEIWDGNSKAYKKAEIEGVEYKGDKVAFAAL